MVNNDLIRFEQPTPIEMEQLRMGKLMESMRVDSIKQALMKLDELGVEYKILNSNILKNKYDD